MAIGGLAEAGEFDEEAELHPRIAALVEAFVIELLIQDHIESLQALLDIGGVLRLAEFGAENADGGEKPKPTEGKSFFDTGVSLVTDKPVSGIKSIDTKAGLGKCWG